MRKGYVSILAGAGLLAMTGTAAADPLGFGFNISFGAPAPLYAAPPTYYAPHANSPAPVAHVREDHRLQQRGHARAHLREEVRRGHGYVERSQH
jgi:hypothetical protein